MKRYFVTGTDTDVGKTTVSAALLGAVRGRGLCAAALKPAESGCVDGPEGLVPADASLLLEAAGGWQRLGDVCLYRFGPPIAPGVAAEAEGIALDLDRVVTEAARVSADLLLMEGAGGWLVPLGGGRLISDLAVAFGAPVLVVARCGLGTINHTLLTVESIRARGLTVAGVVFCDADGVSDAAATRQNAHEIATACGVRVLGVLPYVPSCDLEALAAAAEAHLDLNALV